MDKVKISAVSYLNSKPFVYGIVNSEIINKIDLDFIASKVSQDDLEQVMLAFLKTTEKSEFDENQVVRSFVTGFIVKMLLNEYVGVRELYLSYDEEFLFSELKDLKEKLDIALSEKDNMEIHAQHLTAEMANYELKLKTALSEQSMVYEAQISNLNKEKAACRLTNGGSI
jgi:hypothetical protein